MFRIRNVFKAKPGKGKNLVEVFKKVFEHTKDYGIKSNSISTDVTGPYWTVVLESDVENLNDYFEMMPKMRENKAVMEAMDGYIASGHREILKVEFTG